MHIIFLDHAFHDLERQSFIPENQVQKPSYKIHTLAVVHLLRIDQGVSVQNTSQVVASDLLDLRE